MFNEVLDTIFLLEAMLVNLLILYLVLRIFFKCFWNWAQNIFKRRWRPLRQSRSFAYSLAFWRNHCDSIKWIEKWRENRELTFFKKITQMSSILFSFSWSVSRRAELSPLIVPVGVSQKVSPQQSYWLEERKGESVSNNESELFWLHLQKPRTPGACTLCLLRARTQTLGPSTPEW